MLYKTGYDSWHQAKAGEDDLHSSWHSFAQKMLGQLDLREKNLLEIGCGRGGVSQYIAHNYPEISRLYACDFSPAAIETAKEKFGSVNDRIEWKVQDLQNLELNDNSIDVAISLETIEHIPQARKGIKELYRVLKPGGKLILTCPNYFNLFGIWCLYRKIIGKPFDEGGQPFVRYIQLPAIYRHIRQTGFKIKHFHSIDLIIPARVPKHFFADRKLPLLLSFMGYRTFYFLEK